MLLKWDQPDGLYPRLDAKKLPEQGAQVAENVNLLSSNWEVLYDATEVYSLPDASRVNIYNRRESSNVLTCGTNGAVLATYQGIANASFKITIDGTAYEVKSINLTTAVSLANVATFLQTALRAATGNLETVTYASNYFTFTAFETIGYLETVSAPIGTDIAGATHLNGKTGAGTLDNNASTSEWLSWTSVVDVVEGPLNEDPYSRIYWTGDSSGKLQVRGTFGTRDAEIEEPDEFSACGVTSSIIFDATSVTCIRYIGACGADKPACTYVSHTATDTGFEIVFRSPSHKTNEAVTLYTDPRFQLTIPSVGSLPSTAGDLTWGADKLELSSSSVKYAEFQITGQGNVENPDNSGFDPTYTYNFQAFDITFTINMNYTQGSTNYLYYVQTYVDDTGAEGPPSDISDFITREPGQKVTLDNFPAPTDPNIVARRIYRTASGTSEQDFLFLVELPLATTSYVDILQQYELQEPLPKYGNPPDFMENLVVMAGGILAASKGKKIYFSEPFLPHVWPPEYNLPVPFDVVALAVSGNDLVVMTTGHPSIVTGSAPEIMTQRRIMLNQSCIAKRGVAQIGDLIVYPSPDGLVGINDGMAKLLTESYFQIKDWEAISPSTLIAAVHDKKYFGWTSSTAIIFDFDEGLKALTTTTETTTGVFADLEDDALYLIQSNKIAQWNAGATALTMKWRSKEIQFPRPVYFTCAKVIAPDYSSAGIKLRLRADGTQVAEIDVLSETAFRIPILRPERVWSFEVTGVKDIDSIWVGTSMTELRNG